MQYILSAKSARALLAPLLPMFFLAACNGGGGVPDTDAAAPVDTPVAVGETVATSVVGEPVPGQTLKLRAELALPANGAIEWSQTGGPAVSLQPAGENSVQFRVPPLGRDALFRFDVKVTGADGHTQRRRVNVRVRALSWKDLDVVESALSDSFVVFRANKDNSQRVDLYRADLDGSNLLRLNGPLAPGANVHTFSIAPDGTSVAYLADGESRGVAELFVVDAAGGDAHKVSGALAAGGNVTEDFLWSPDSWRIAYRADQNVDERFELFAAYSDGREAVRLSGDMTAGGDVVEANFYWSDDARRIAYRANQFNDNVLELFVSTRDGGANWRVSNLPAVGGGVLGNFAWMPGGRQLAYLADEASADLYELFVVNDDGSGNTRVSGPLVAAGSVFDFAWAPGGERLAYRAEQLSDEMVELYSVRPDGSDNTLVSALAFSTSDVESYAWSPDGAAIAYLADQLSDGVIELFGAGPDGAANRRLSGPLAIAGNVREFAWSPDSAYVAYRADQVLDGVQELFTSSPDGALNVQVSGPLDAGGEVQADWRWSGDGGWLVYRADQRTDGVLELFSALPDGSANLLVSGSLVAGGNVESPQGAAFEWAPDASRLVYSADQVQDGRYEIFVTSPDSGVAIASLSGTLTGGGDVLNFALASRPGAAPPRPRTVLVLHTDSTAVRSDDIAAKLVASGLFDTVDLLRQAAGLPDLAQLSGYRAVLFHSAGFMVDNNALGNTLADYVDSGGGLVTGSWSTFDDPSYVLGGRFRTQGYYTLLPIRTATGGNGLTLVPSLPDHPIVAGLTFNGGQASWQVPAAVAPGSTVVARWSGNNNPLVVTRVINGVRRVDLNFYLASSDCCGTAYWSAASDGDLLMANALLWVMGEI